jgi:copper resistance protein D
VTLLVDLFGYLSIVIHGLTIIAQSMTVGGAIFLVALARPLANRLGLAGRPVLEATIRITRWAALALIACEAATVALQAAVLVDTVDLTVGNVLQAQFAVAGMVKIGGAGVLAVLLWGRHRAPASLLLVASGIVLAAATMTTHAAARLEDQVPLLSASALHQFGAAIWIGAIPAFLAALACVHESRAWLLVSQRFSRLSMVGVASIAISGAVMAVLYVGSFSGLYGTAYGVMVAAKVAMFGALLLLGYGNLRLTRRLARAPGTPVTRLKRFAEVEIGVGFSLFFAAASLTSVPPAVDLTQDRVTWQEIVERNAPVWPRLTSPDHDALALPALQARLDAEARAHDHAARPAFVPGSGDIPARNAADIAWSEYNHHWAGLFMVLIGALALLNQAGVRAARHWPLVFLLLAALIFFRADPEVWPLGTEGFFASLRDIEVLQHKFYGLLIVAFAAFEWRVRTGRATGRAALVFPLITAVGGAALLTHSHAIANIKDQLLIEITHTPLALAGMGAGWARWLELRLDPPASRVAGWIWPVLFVFVGLLLLSYREA